MLKKIKKIISQIDLFLFKKFGSDKSTKFLESMKEAIKIFSYLNEIGKENEVRFVGGCVRKALSGEVVDDIDLATSLAPNEVKKRLNKYNIKVIDTGIAHGTVTAILNNKKFEITTLRKDILTDGRHASVEYTQDWEQDALRRDFSLNAIYVDIEGRIFDPLNGIDDLKNGKVKFIGLAEERIKEDYLRILRYFRFFIQYSKTDLDLDTIKYIKQNINGLNKISKERIFSELEKILSLKNIINLFFNKPLMEIILNIFPQFIYYKRFKKFNELNKNIKNKYDKHLILALLIVDHSNNYEYFCHKYKTSNKIKNRLKNISKNFENIKTKNFFSNENIKKLIYLSNKEEVRDLILFSACENNKAKILEIEKLLEFVKTCEIPKFPISGNYLKKYGYEKGHILGEKLKSLEARWIENNFIIDKKIVEKFLGKTNEN